MPPRHNVYLVPGFFGFANLGDLKYFAHVHDVLQANFASLGIEANVHHVRTWPTASVRKRATRLLQAIHDTSGDDEGPIHLIGHSSGGLDARLLVTAGASLTGPVALDATGARPAEPDAATVESYAARIRSVITVASPHHGTPMVSLFTTMFGGRLLQLLSLATIYVLRYGRLPLSVLLPMGRILVRLDNVGVGSDPLDQLYDELLSDFSDDRQKAIREFFHEVGDDQSLIPQLMPSGMEVFNATTRNVHDVRYGCVVARSRAPGVGSTIAAGWGPYAQASHALYLAIYNLAARMPHDRAPMPSLQQIKALRAAWGEVPDLRDNDGIVPTLSQLWGEVICAVTADHHDVIGHFDDTGHVPPHYDWIMSGSGFKRPHFEKLWADVAGWIAKDGHGMRRKPGPSGSFAALPMPEVAAKPAAARREAATGEK